MNFLIDAQLPKRLRFRLEEAGHDAIHTLDLPLRNKTTDKTIEEISLSEQRIVISKDTDFVDSILVSNRPYKLLLISTGNISNKALEALFNENLESIVEQFKTTTYIELDTTALTVHF